MICSECNKPIWENQSKRFSLRYCTGRHITATQAKQIRAGDAIRKALANPDTLRLFGGQVKE